MPKYKFGDLVYNITEKRSPVAGDEELYIGLEHLDSGSLRVTRWGSKVALKGDKLIMRKGDILFGRRNTYLRRVAIAPHDGLFSAHGMILRAKVERINSEYLPFFIASDYFMDEAIRISVGSLSPTVNWKELKELEFTIPTLEEQEKLVKILLAANNLKEKYEELLAITDDLVKSQFIELFGNPVTNSKKLPTKKLSELGELNRGVSKSRPRNKPELLGGPYPLVQTGEVTAAELYITCYENTYSEARLAQSKMWPKGTLCITIAANIAQTAILGFDACFPDSVVGFLAGDNVKQIYIHYWFGFFQKILEEQAPQVAQKNINLKTLSELDVMVPSLEKQNEFVAFVEQTDKSKFEIKKAIENTSALIKSLMQQNLTN